MHTDICYRIVVSETAIQEKTEASTEEDQKSAPAVDLADQVRLPTFTHPSELGLSNYQINSYLASNVLPNIRRYLTENDRVVTVCSNIIYYIVGPAIKLKSR